MSGPKRFFTFSVYFRDRIRWRIDPMAKTHFVLTSTVVWVQNNTVQPLSRFKEVRGPRHSLRARPLVIFLYFNNYWSVGYQKGLSKVRGQSPLRPEFIESTYFLYKATGDEHYLDVGKAVLNSIEVLAKVPCGYAAIKDVRTGRHEDRMDSFVLAELFKYLFLLFSEESDLTVNVNDYLFTTEAHLLPLNIGSTRGAESISPPSTAPLIRREEGDETYDEDDEAVCPAHPRLKMRFPGMTEDIRKPLQNLVQQACPTVEQSAGSDTPQLRASEFQAGNKEHVATLEKMGIRLVTMKDGRVQLLPTTSQAASTEDARQGMMFMQDMIQLSETAAVQEEPQTRLVRYLDDEAGSGSVGEGANVVDLIGGPAQFGYDLSTQRSVEAKIVIIKPFSGCGEITNAEEDVRGKIAIMQRGDCMLIVKARAVEEMGAVGGIVIDNNADSSASSSPIFAMSGDGSDDVGIPLVFLFDLEGRRILHAHWKRPRMKVVLTDGKNPSSPKKTMTTTTSTTIEEEFKIVAASDKDEVIGDEKKTNDANESHDKYLDIYQVLDGESEIVHVGNDELKLVIRSMRDSGRESSGWLFHTSLRVVDAGGSRDKENPNRETDESKRKFYLYIDADVPFSTTSSSAASNPSTSLPPAASSTPNPPSDSAPPSTTLSNADGSPPWEQLRTSIVSVMESTTNIKSTDDDAAEVNDAIDALTFIASRALDRQRGKASRLRLSNEQMRRFGALSHRLRVLDESIVEREVVSALPALPPPLPPIPSHGSHHRHRLYPEPLPKLPKRKLVQIPMSLTQNQERKVILPQTLCCSSKRNIPQSSRLPIPEKVGKN